MIAAHEQGGGRGGGAGGGSGHVAGRVSHNGRAGTGRFDGFHSINQVHNFQNRNDRFLSRNHGFFYRDNRIWNHRFNNTRYFNNRYFNNRYFNNRLFYRHSFYPYIYYPNFLYLYANNYPYNNDYPYYSTFPNYDDYSTIYYYVPYDTNTPDNGNPYYDLNLDNGDYNLNNDYNINN